MTLADFIQIQACPVRIHHHSITPPSYRVLQPYTAQLQGATAIHSPATGCYNITKLYTAKLLIGCYSFTQFRYRVLQHYTAQLQGATALHSFTQSSYSPATGCYSHTPPSYRVLQPYTAQLQGATTVHSPDTG